ncbi:neurexin-4-like isoform X1 [Acropora millepora]|uniref:neurexin-4-like isoform X1 n=1 Tax=Acropora millepora TaxID=45264 RepID=UPI001CF29B79|nr:neurexin-4-like isoform X1 [Acropora millepora]
MLSSPKGEVRQIFQSAFSFLKICTLLGLQYFACSALDNRVVTFKEPILNKTLKGHVICSEEVPNEGSCRVNCYLNPDCVSINMRHVTEGMLTCEMNNSTSGNTTALENKTGYTYLEIENPCSGSPCLNGGTCQAGFTSKGFRCQCINSSFANHRCEIKAKSCSHLKRLSPEANNGTYLIDPDGRGTLAPFLVFCDMTDKKGIGVTVISHDSEDRKFVNGCKAPGCYSRDIHYVGANLSQLAGLTEVSSHCEQFIRYECFHSRLRFRRKNKNRDPFGWWVSRNSSQMTYWGGALPGSNNCACGMNDSCKKRKNNSTLKCNCDNNDAQWREDSGLLTDKSTLPVTQLRFGDVGFSKSNRDENGYHTLGKFKCYMDSTLVSPLME